MRTFPICRYAYRAGPTHIFLASLDGTQLSQVTSEATQGADWSSRGQIAFSCFASPCPPGCDDIYVTRLGGSPRRLTYRGGANPSWSPHGKKLAFVRAARGGTGDQGDIFIVGRGGRGLRRLTYRGGVGGRVARLAGSPPRLARALGDPRNVRTFPIRRYIRPLQLFD